MDSGIERLVVQEENKETIRKHTVVIQIWEESEKGWGPRPDGYSLHLTAVDTAAFIRDYWAGMPDAIQEVYSRPDGMPYQIEVDDETFALLEKSKNGIRSYDSPPDLLAPKIAFRGNASLPL